MSPEERAALVRHAESLRTEISDLTAERDAARAAQSASAEDARLIAEVQALSTKRDEAQAERDQAVSATEAIDIMKKLLDDEEAKRAEEVKLVDPPVEAPIQAESTKTSKGGKL
jgi:hypothetical protein